MKRFSILSVLMCVLLGGCGVSVPEAQHHVAGMKESGIVISINSDENAPINQIADYVINGTVEEVVPKLIKYYKENSK